MNNIVAEWYEEKRMLMRSFVKKETFTSRKTELSCIVYAGNNAGMMTTDGEERDRTECVYIQHLHEPDECSDKEE